VSHFLLPPTSNMVNTVLTDGEEDAHLGRSRRNPKPSAALLDHPEQATLPSHLQAIETFRAAEAARRAAERQIALEEDAANPISSPSGSPSRDNSPVAPSGTDTTVPLVLPGPKRRRAYVSDEEEESNDEREDARTNPKPGNRHTFLF
jgi:hypothetical protein